MLTSSQDKFSLFFSKYRTFNYKKGETILRADEDPIGVFYLKKGFVRLYSISQNGEELTLIIFRSGEIFPLMWTMNNTGNLYYLEAQTPVELMRAPREKFLNFLNQHPDILFNLTQEILARLGRNLRRMEYLVFGDAYSKIASIISLCAQRFGKKSGKKIVIEVPLTHNDIASLVGVTRETASIEIKKLEKKGLISYQGRFVVVKSLQNLEKQSLL